MAFVLHMSYDTQWASRCSSSWLVLVQVAYPGPPGVVALLDMDYAYKSPDHKSPCTPVHVPSGACFLT
eukprot:2372797-Amphidinium_carterae.2